MPFKIQWAERGDGDGEHVDASGTEIIEADVMNIMSGFLQFMKARPGNGGPPVLVALLNSEAILSVRLAKEEDS